jgi:organic radical activating enzyme
VVETLAFLSQKSGNVTLSGGEIFQQPAALAELVSTLHYIGPRHVIAYSGYTWEELFSTSHPARPWLSVILPYIDVLVDGRFIRERDDDLIVYRGSRNQRPIDVGASLAEGRVVTLDWDNPEIVIGESGELILPQGLAADFGEMGEVKSHALCGQVRR